MTIDFSKKLRISKLNIEDFYTLPYEYEVELVLYNLSNKNFTKEFLSLLLNCLEDKLFSNEIHNKILCSLYEHFFVNSKIRTNQYDNKFTVETQVGKLTIFNLIKNKIKDIEK